MNLPPLTVEFAISMVMLAVGTAVGVYFAARRQVVEPELQAEEAMADYHEEIAPEQAKGREELIRKLRETALRLGENGREVTSDDVHAECPIPTGEEGRIMGQAFEKGRWHRVGWRPTTRAAANKRPVSIWIRKEFAA